MKHTLLILFLIISFISCDKENEDFIPVEVNNIELVDIGQIPYEFNFKSENQNNRQSCTIHTIQIRKNDTIDIFRASNKGNIIKLYITSSPYDLDCMDDDCFSVHDIKFDLDISRGEYTMDITINNLQIKPFKFIFK